MNQPFYEQIRSGRLFLLKSVGKHHYYYSITPRVNAKYDHSQSCQPNVWELKVDQFNEL